MADEVKDQAQVTPEKSYKLPEKDFFFGDNMDKFIEEQGLFKEEQPAPKADAAPAKKPCANCPDEVAPDKDQAAKPETRKPIRVLKVAGKDYPVYTEKDLDDLAQKGAHYTQERQKDSRWEKSLSDREDRFSQAVDRLGQIASLLQPASQPQAQPGNGGTQEATTKETDIDLETIEDPAMKSLAKRLLDDNRKLKQDVEEAKGVTKNVTAERMKTELDQVLAGARERHPFEEYVDEDTKENITQGVFAGLMSYKVNRDRLLMAQDPNVQLKPVHEYIEETARDMNRLENYFKSKSAVEAGIAADKVTADLVISKFPEVAQELGQRAVAEHLKKLEEAPPVAHSRSEDLLKRRETPRKPGEMKSIDDYLAEAVKDPEISAALDEAQRKSRFYK